MAIVLLGEGFRAEREIVVERFPDITEFEQWGRGAIRLASRAFPEVPEFSDFGFRFSDLSAVPVADFGFRVFGLTGAGREGKIPAFRRVRALCTSAFGSRGS